MIFEPLALPDILLCKPRVHEDGRGYFMESFRQDQFEAQVGYPVPFVQENESGSRRGVLRGLHFQTAPHAQAKLVRVVLGAILDVAVDIRRGSPTFGQHVAVELSAENRHQLFVPHGFAHGFVVLSEEAVVAYKVDDYYAPECDRGLKWDDPALAIEWPLPLSELLLSDKDLAQPLLSELGPMFEYGEPAHV